MNSVELSDLIINVLSVPLDRNQSPSMSSAEKINKNKFFFFILYSLTKLFFFFFSFSYFELIAMVLLNFVDIGVFVGDNRYREYNNNQSISNIRN